MTDIKAETPTHDDNPEAPPTKKRKRGDTKVKAKTEEGGRTVKRGANVEWKPEEDVYFKNLMKKHKSIKLCLDDFNEQFPGLDRTYLMFKNRWNNKLKNDCVDLDDKEIKLLDEAIAQVENEKTKYIIEKFKSLCTSDQNCELTRGYVEKHLKQRCKGALPISKLEKTTKKSSKTKKDDSKGVIAKMEEKSEEEDADEDEEPDY